MLRAALEYFKKHNFSVIPIGKDKRPLIKWEEFQKRRPTEDKIQAWWKKWPDANIGIPTGMISGIAVIDIDEAEKAEPVLESLLPDGIDIPTVSTPRGGKHLYFQCPDEKIGNNAGIVPGADLRANGGYIVVPPSVNDKGKGYQWIIGLNEAGLSPLPAKYLEYLSIYAVKGGYKGGESRTPVIPVTQMFEHGRRDEDLFHVANHLVKSGMPEPEIMQVLRNIAKSWGEENQDKWFSDKIKSALKRQAAREIDLPKEVAGWISVTTGYFSVTDCFRELQSVIGVTKHDERYKALQTHIRVIFHRLKEKGIIEKVGNKDGIYRRVEDSCNEIDFLNASTEAINVQWPLGVETYVKTHPKNIIIIAGAPNSGKTAFLLKFAEMNMANFKINYFSSEMGPIELKVRLSKFGHPLADFKKIKWIDRSSNFADVIRPEEVNIIDFLEMTNDFYLVAQYIKEIFDKLTTGIAVIALQKNPGQALGLGGARSLEKARLYLSMDAHKIRIEKGKNWADGSINPNGLYCKFKLAQGCKFIREDAWQYEGDKS